MCCTEFAIALTYCIRWQKHNLPDNLISYLGTLVKTGSEFIEVTLCEKPMVAVFEAQKEKRKLPKA